MRTPTGEVIKTNQSMDILKEVPTDTSTVERLNGIFSMKQRILEPEIKEKKHDKYYFSSIILPSASAMVLPSN
jgi:hypothetical protein